MGSRVACADIVFVIVFLLPLLLLPPLPPLLLLLLLLLGRTGVEGTIGRDGRMRRRGSAGVLVHRRIDPWNSWGRRQGPSVCPPFAREKERATGWVPERTSTVLLVANVHTCRCVDQARIWQWSEVSLIGDCRLFEWLVDRSTEKVDSVNV